MQCHTKYVFVAMYTRLLYTAKMMLPYEYADNPTIIDSDMLDSKP